MESFKSFRSLSHRVWVLGGTRTHLSHLAKKYGKGMGTLLTQGFDLEGQWIEAAQALRITDTQAIFYTFQTSKPLQFHVFTLVVNIGYTS